MIDYEISGKVALVTGVSRKAGIGRAIAHALASAGAHVFTTYYRANDRPEGDPREAEQIVDELRAVGIIAAGMEADLAELNAAHVLFTRAEAEIGPVDILVNNATLDVPSNINTINARSLDAHYAVNVRGATLLCAEFARRFRGGHGGRIVNMTSGQSRDPMPESLPYAITKGAIEALTISLSASMAQQGVTVNAVDPGATDTGWIDDSLRAELERGTIGSRVGAPADAARIVLYLCSSQAGWITGQVIRSRGGA